MSLTSKCILLTVLMALASAAIAQTSQEHKVETLTTERVGPYRPERQADADKVRELIVTQTNEFRKSEKLSALKQNDKLAATAQKFAEYMAGTDRYGHTADGRQASERVTAQEYEFCQVAENIAYFFATVGFGTQELADRAVQGWKDSPGHRRNMLKPHITETGIGVAQSEKTGVYYAVQLFGRPRDAAIAFSIANRTETEAKYTLGEEPFALPPQYTRKHQLCVPSALELTREADDDATTSDTDDSQAGVEPNDDDRYIIVVREGAPTLISEE